MAPDPSRIAERVALVSVCSNTVLLILKFVVAGLTGSVSILSEGLHSSMDLVASVIAFLAVRISRKPADSHHPWGHGKAENVSGVAEGLLIFVAAALIVGEAVKKLSAPEPVDEPLWGMAVMGLSAVVNTAVAWVLYRTARKTGSLALEADALHLKTDVYTSLGVAAGLGLLALTGWTWADPVVALAVAALIVKEAWHLVAKSFAPLMDGTLGAEDLAALAAVLDRAKGPGVGFHDLKARQAGAKTFLEVHVTLPGTVTLAEAHAEADRLEAALGSGVEALIHLEPDGTP